MRNIRNVRGEINLSTILTLAIVIFVVYAGVKFTPAIMAQYQFKDVVIDEAKFSRAKDAQTVKDALVKKAAELGLPITRANVKVEREPTRTRIQVQYKLSVEWLPGRIYSWDVNEVAESVLF